MSNKLDRVKLMTLAMQRYPWEQGVCAQAFLEIGDEDAALSLALEAVHRQKQDGRPAMLDGGIETVTDPCACGDAMLFAAQKTGDMFFRDALKKLDDWVLKTAPRSGKGVLYHITLRPEFWVDSLYMLPPYLASAGYYDEALRQIEGYWEALFLPDKNLLGHIYNEQEKRFVRSDCWGVGNGWAVAGLARVIAALPDDMREQKDELVRKVTLILDSAIKLIRTDGLFHDVLDNTETFVETNFAQMAAYTIYRGVAGGWLDKAYLPHADRMRKAAGAKVDEYGMVRGVCGAPDFDRSGEAVEGQAFYILMEAAARDYEATV